MDNDILGNLPSGVLTWWKPSQYRENYESKSLTVYRMCPAGEGRKLVSSIFNPAKAGVVIPREQGLPLTDISIDTHESNKVDFITLTYSKERDEDDDDPDNPEDPEGPTYEFDGRECEITVSLVDEPITQCKLYKSQVDALDNATLKDLCALMGGQLADEQGVSLTDKLNGKVPPSLLSKILRGQTHYKAAYTQCRLTIPGKVDISNSGQLGSRAGLPSLPDGQVWLCGGGGLTRRNGRTVTQITYVGGNWDPEIYK